MDHATTETHEEAAVDKKLSIPFNNRRKQLERDLEHITQEMYRRNRELADTNKILSLLQTIDALVLESHTSLKMVCEHITQAVTQVTSYPFVGLLTRTSHTRDELTLQGWSGSSWLGKETTFNFSRPLHVPLTDDWFSSPEGTRVIPITDLPAAQIAAFLHCSDEDVERLHREIPLQSLYVVKLLARRRLVGLLVVGFMSPGELMNESDGMLLNRISDSIGMAVDNKLLFEENQYVLKQLRDSNTKLKALDEAKDDFVSMASHQLRTPLTSVKGYLSMVMEGDVGEVNEQQKAMLSQAFFSSQRMVYLIADLLNVSRLRTGKFLIEPTVVDLAKVVEEEVVQLAETAKAHNLTVTYHKPETFPELMLDETKTRQIVMNFIDNAIYYTPSGGEIKVELLEKPSTIELRVTDNGIGVPKSEQPHLFTKFYRANNARTARPDGTGLGLFMAKKVIVGQHGSTIFESTEGKGSTFGFVFSKSKLAVPEVAKESTEVTQ
jgi:signal transduction histidine kinase